MQESTIQGFQLSRLQKYLWSSGVDTAKTQLLLDIVGPLDVDLLKRVLQVLVARHEILRTTFHALDGMEYPLQTIDDEARLSWQHLPLTRFSPSEQENRIAKTVNGERLLTLDIERDALLRCILFTRSEEHATLLMTTSGIIADGQSLKILVQELIQGYTALTPTTYDEDNEPIQYAQFAAWQDEELEDKVVTEDAYQFWQRQQASLSHQPTLPFIQHHETTGISSWQASLPVVSLTELAAEYHATVEDVLLTSWQLLLWQLSHEADVVVGFQVSGRDFEELANVPGPFSHSVPFHTHFADRATFAELLNSVSSMRQQAQDWQVDYELSPHTQSSAFYAGFDFIDAGESITANGATFSVAYVATFNEQFSINLSCLLTSQTLLVTLRCDTGAWSSEQLKRLTTYLQSILDIVVRTPEIPGSAIELVTDQERHAQLETFNPETYQLSDNPSVFQRFAEQAALTPDDRAVLFEQESLTYAELNARANQLAHFLIKAGVGADIPVGIYLDNSVEMIVGLLGILKAGGAYLPLDPRYPQERLSFMLADIQAPIVLTLQAMLNELPDFTGRFIALDEDWSVISQESGANPDPAITPDNLAYVIYTSGSTGQPKGVMIPHKGLTNYLDWCLSTYTPYGGNGALVHSSISFDLTVTSLFAPLVCGQQVTVVGRAHGIDDLTKALNDENMDYSFIKLTPAHVRLLGRFIANKQVSAHITNLIIGGEALFADDIATWQEELPDIHIYNEYGPTETVVGCSVYEVPISEAVGGAIPIGTPIVNAQLYILDAHMRLVPSGVPGEIYIGGAGLARGYARRPDLTAERFVPHPFSHQPGERLYKSGDLARYRDDGTIEYLGRADQQIKIRGFRIEPGEIELVLGRHPALQEVAVIAREDTPGNKRLVAYMVAHAVTQGYSVNDIRAFAHQFLPDYMVPSAYVFMDSLPLTTNGKLDQRALPVPEASRPVLDHEYVEPSTREEQILTGVWSQVLTIEQIGIYDNYFALGGDSIRSIQVVALAQERGLQITVDQIFDQPTIHGLAQVIGGSTTAEEETEALAPYSMISSQDRQMLPEDVENAYPLTRLQAGMIFHKEMVPRSSIYHDITSFHIKAPLSVEHLQQAIGILVQCHPALRTSFELSTYSEPLQLVHRQGNINLHVVDLRDRSFHEQRRYLEQWIEEEKAVGFDTSSWPMMRLSVHIRSSEAYQFTVSFHHAILDGWSEATMLTELFHNYLRLMQGQQPEIHSPTTSFQDFVALELAALNTPEQQDFWTQKLADNTFLSLPRLKAPPADKSELRDIIVLDVPLSDQTSEGLKHLALTAAVPIKDVLLAAHIRVLSLLGGLDDVLTCLVSSGRPESRDGDRVLGLFINSLPFRLQLNGGTWLDLVRATFDAECESLPYRRYPMAEVKSLQGGQSLSETLFYFTHYHVYQSLQEIADVDILDHYLYEETSFAIAANFRVDPFSSHVHVNLKCDGSQLTREQIHLMGTYYAQTLRAMAADPTQRYEQAMLLSPEEQQLLLHTWNHTQFEPAPQPTALCLHELFAQQVQRAPQATALTFEEREVSYEQLDARSNQIAHYLQTRGVGPDVLVGLCFERSPELLASLLGILKAGGAYLPLDPTTPAERLSFMVEDSQVQLVLTHQPCIEQLPALLTAQVVNLDEVESLLSTFPVTTPATPVNADNLAYVIYTSGSTGKPKGTLINHSNVTRLLTSTQPWFEFGPDDVWTLFHSYAFDFSVWEIWGALAYGGRLIIVPYWITRSPEAFYALVAEQKVTVLNQTPSAFKQLNEQDEQNGQALALRFVIFGGEALDPSLPRAWFERHDDQQPQLINMYGITETTVHVTYQPITQESLALESGSVIGRPIADLETYILDSQLRLVPTGVAGELYIGGAGLARGYLNRPELTAERFIAHPFSSVPEARLYRSGDLCRYRIDGKLEYLGRIDHQVKIRGFRIELGEIEAVLAEHPQLQDVLVMLREDMPGNKRLVAYMIARDAEQTPTISELRTFLQPRLPDYMVPSLYLFLPTFPLTANGKIDHRALPVPEQVRPELEHTYVKSQTPEQEILAGIWSQALMIDRVGIEDNFFELGGHSLIATRVVAMIRDAFQVNMPLRSIFEAPNIASLSLVLAQLQQAVQSGTAVYTALPLIEPDLTHRYDPFPLTDIQQAYWVGRNSGFELGDIPAHIYLEFDTTGVDLTRLTNGVRRLIQRHDMLRAIVLQDGRQQILAEVPPYEIKYLDLRTIEPETATHEITTTRERMSHQIFTTDQWPLFEITAHQLDAERIKIYFSIDLLITDADSLSILNREIGQLYLDPEIELPPLDISFRDYVLAEIDLRHSAIYHQSRDYWLSRLETLPMAPELPLKKDFQSLTHARFARQHGELERSIWAKLKARAARAGITPSGLLLAVYAEILGLWSKHQRFTLNATTYNCLPLHPHAKNLIGDFTSLTLFEVDRTQPISFEKFAQHIQKQFLEDLDHNHFSGIQVLRELARQRRSTLDAAMPVVFTSTLPLHTREEQRESPIPAELVMGITQSPQTLFDYQVSEESGNLTVRWDYIAEAFPEGMVEDMFAVYKKLLHGLAEDEQLWHIPTRTYLVPESQLSARDAINATGTSISSGLLQSGFLAQVQRQPYAPAIISTRRELSYQELDQRSATMAHRLQSLGVQPNQLVAVCMEKGWEQIVAVLAILRAGAAYLPIDPSLPTTRLHYLLQQGEATIALTQPWLINEVSWPAGLQHLSIAEDDEYTHSELNEIQTQPSDLAYVIYTSGSTGLPKGVMIDHQGALNTIEDINQRFSVESNDRVLALSALNFDLSVYDIFGLLAAGGSIVMPGARAERDPQQWMELMQKHQVSLWNTVPALLEMLIEYAQTREQALASSLRLALLSGDWINLTLPERLWHTNPTTQIISLGGATEASIWSIFSPITEVRADWKSIPYGKPLSNQSWHVFNERFEPCPQWVPGQLYIGGIGLAQGYWRDELKTAASFIQHPESGERLYRTGDLGRYLPSGEIEFLGREDSQVKIQGHRIELGEIEATLQDHPQIKDAVVLAQGEARGTRSLIAYVVPEPVSMVSSTAPAPQTQVPLQPLLDLQQRADFKSQHLNLRPVAVSDTIMSLPAPALNSAAEQRYLTRHSYQQFAQEALPLLQLSEFLSCLRQMLVDGKPRYLYASAGGIYPVQTYVYIKPGRVEHYVGGTYYYHPIAHELILLKETSAIDETVHWPSNRQAVRSSAFSIFLIGKMDAITPLYQSAAKDFCLLEAGLMTQLLEMSALENSMGLCQIGTLDFARIREHFLLDEDHLLLYSLIGGQQPVDAHAQQNGRRVQPVIETSTSSGTGQQVVQPSLDIASIQLYMKERLPYYMLPASIMILDELPLTSNGKVDRKALPAVEFMTRTIAEDRPPQDELESTIAKVLQKILGLEHISMHANFFDIGADSLSMIRGHRELQTELNITIPIVDMFLHTSVEALANHLRTQEVEQEQLISSQDRVQLRANARQRRANTRTTPTTEA